MPNPAPDGAGTTTSPAPEHTALQDGAVTFLHDVAPPTGGDRTRAFAALLRALATPASTR